LPEEEQANYQFTIEPQRPGQIPLTTELRYTDASGTRNTVSNTRILRVEPLDPAVSIALSAADVGPSERTSFQLNVANERAKSISGLTLQVQSDDVKLLDTQRVAATVPAEEKKTYEIEAREVDPGATQLTVQGSYTLANGDQQEFTRRLETTVTERPNPGRVNLTGIRITPGQSGLEVRGTASNAGTTNVTGVVISVEESRSVVPAQSQASFFVGDIQAGEFTSFDVSAVPQTNGTVTVPLTVSYVVDGTDVQRTVELEYRPPTQRTDPQQSGGGFPFAAIGGAVLVIGSAALVWRRWQK
jgi:hypothetical protein